MTWTSTYSRIAPTGDPSDVIQRYLLRGALSDQGFAPPAFPAAPHKSLKAGSKAAAIKALERRSVALGAVYRKLWPGVYKKAAKKNVKAGAWSFPSCTPSAAAEYDSYTYSGDPCIMTAPAATDRRDDVPGAGDRERRRLATRSASGTRRSATAARSTTTSSRGASRELTSAAATRCLADDPAWHRSPRNRFEKSVAGPAESGAASVAGGTRTDSPPLSRRCADGSWRVLEADEAAVEASSMVAAGADLCRATSSMFAAVPSTHSKTLLLVA